MQKNTEDITEKKSNIKNNKVGEKITIKAGKKTTKTAEKKTSTKNSSTKKGVANSTSKKSTASKKTTAVSKSSSSVKEEVTPSVKKSSTAKKTNAVAKKSSAQVAASKNKPSAKTKKSTSSAKKVSTKRSSKKITKKSSTPLTSRKSSVVKKSSTKKIKVESLEYYDLPYRYNQTVVKILAQTPNTLFVYWDISDSDREIYIKEFGDNFFNDTYPVLIVHNKTMNYSFEIEINDFANSWYFTVNDAKCNYEIELGRRAKNNIYIPNNYVYVTSSNVIEAPNNHILFEKAQKVLFFRNVKTGNKFGKDISQFNFMQYMGRIYNIYDIYKKIYKADELKDIEQNPSSQF